MTAAFVAPAIDWSALAPVAIVLDAAVVGVLVEAFVPQRGRRAVQLALALVAAAASLVATAQVWTRVPVGGGLEVLGGSMVLDRPAVLLQGLLAVLGLVALLVVADRTELLEDAFAPSVAAVPGSDYEKLATQRGLVQTEVFPLVMFAIGGMMIFPAAGDLLTLFVALEVFSLPLYLLSGTARRRRLISQEASLKYFLLGAFASALLLFGIALLYGFAGSVRLADIAAATTQVVGLDPLLLAGAVLVLVGLLFKVGAVPFHSWTPDVYQGAPTPITGFMAACTKVAAFGALLRFVYVALPALEWDVRPLLAAVAVLTMVVGTVVAIVQDDVKRLLAYSSIAHAGFVLVGIGALTQSAIPAVIVYLLGYGVTTLGAFAIVTQVRSVTEGPGGPVTAEATRVTQWTGLGRTHPGTAVAFSLFLLSFAGIPLTAGFIGKFAVFSAAVEGGLTWLVVVGVLVSAAAVFFYVRLIVLMFFTDPQGSAGEHTTVVRSEGLTAVAIGVAVLGTVALGVFPQPVLDLLADSAVFLP